MNADLDAILKDARPRAIAAVSRQSGDLAAAEDAVHDAIIAALRVWEVQGIPDSPAAWLITSARNRLIDRWRSDKRHQRAVRLIAATSTDSDAQVADTIDDDLLRLIFTCCHPALSEEAQIALTLRTIAGFSTNDIASALLINERAVEQRLRRARNKIKDAGIGFELPRESDLPDRFQTVFQVVYLIFNRGYSAGKETELVDRRICAEAIWLARLLCRLEPGAAEAEGLLALLLLQHARHRARADGTGQLVTLAQQDRSLWDGNMIEEGRRLLRQALRRRTPGTFQTQAAIAALHSEASDPAETDWAQIEQLYAWLEVNAPSPVVTVNRCVAQAMAGNPELGLTKLSKLSAVAAMANYVPYHAAMAELSALCGQTDGAIRALKRAIATTQSEAEAIHFRGRVAELQDAGQGDSSGSTRAR